jgi:DNA polymerase-4
MASDMRNPYAITILRRREMPALLWNKPCQTLYGIGSRTADKLLRLNIRTIGELAVADERVLTERFGVYGAWMKQAANGLDDSPVEPLQEASKSIGHTTTLPADLTGREQYRRVLLNLADQTTRRLRNQRLVSSTVQVTIRDPDMRTITRAAGLGIPTDTMEDVYQVACRLMETHWKEGAPIRLLGITLQNLASKEDTPLQMDLFSYEEKPRRDRLVSAMDSLRNKYGEDAVLTAGMLGDDPSTLIRNKKIRGTSLQKDFLREKPINDENDN